MSSSRWTPPAPSSSFNPAMSSHLVDRVGSFPAVGAAAIHLVFTGFAYCLDDFGNLNQTQDTGDDATSRVDPGGFRDHSCQRCPEGIR
jgi:hypothetical protein